MIERFGEDESGLLIAGPVRPGEKGARLSGYIGPSMNPTLSEGDMLEIQPYKDRSVRPGDVVFFRRPGGEGFIVHRVVVRSPVWIVTRGDNNPQADPFLLRPSDIMGRVAAARRRNRRRRISGGFRGLVRGRLLMISIPVKRRGSRLLHPLYRALAFAGFFRRLLPPSVRPRCVESASLRGGTRLHLVFLGRVIGRYAAAKRSWVIRRPFKLFVDEASLPRPPMNSDDRGHIRSGSLR
ncbi:MAG: signal peptidase I [Candidatus Aminicenantes bacterium]|nr:signal peptidase I [Candidatus Aminicenantes bacterium]